MKRIATSETAHVSVIAAREMKETAWDEVGKSFELFCLLAGVDSLTQMLAEDTEELCDSRYGRVGDKPGYRWGTTTGQAGFHGGKMEMKWPRVRGQQGGEIALPSWEAAQDASLLQHWAVNLMLMNVATRKYRLAVRLLENAVPELAGSGISKLAASRRFVALI